MLGRGGTASIAVPAPMEDLVPIDRRTLLAAGGGLSLAALAAACSSPTSGGAAGSSSASGSASGGSTAAPARPVMDDATRATVDRIVTEQFQQTGVAGLAGVVRIGSQSWTGTRGVADLSTGAPFVATDTMRIASITKTFTATAVLRLVDQGKIRLTDPLEKYVPGVVNGTTATIQDLLGMRSGIPDFTANAGFDKRFDADPTMAWTDRDTLAVIAESPKPDFAPGEKVAYCDSNYALLGMVLATVTGRTAGEVITSEVVQPLGLKATSYPTTVSVPAPHPQAYVPDVTAPDAPFDNKGKPPKLVNDVNPAVASTAGAMISTLADLQTWGTELATGTLLTPATQALRLRTQRFTGVSVNFGYGLGITNLGEFLGHDGAIYGYSSVVFTRPQTDTQMAFVANESTNSTTPTLTVVVNLVKALYPDQLA